MTDAPNARGVLPVSVPRADKTPEQIAAWMEDAKQEQDGMTAQHYYETRPPEAHVAAQRLYVAQDKAREAERTPSCCASAEHLHDLANRIQSAQLAMLRHREVLVATLNEEQALRVSCSFESVKAALTGKRKGQRPGYTADAQGNVVQMRSKP